MEDQRSASSRESQSEISALKTQLKETKAELRRATEVALEPRQRMKAMSDQQERWRKHESKALQPQLDGSLSLQYEQALHEKQSALSALEELQQGLAKMNSEYQSEIGRLQAQIRQLETELGIAKAEARKAKEEAVKKNLGRQHIEALSRQLELQQAALASQVAAHQSRQKEYEISSAKDKEEIRRLEKEAERLAGRLSSNRAAATEEISSLKEELSRSQACVKYLEDELRQQFKQQDKTRQRAGSVPKKTEGKEGGFPASSSSQSSFDHLSTFSFSSSSSAAPASAFFPPLPQQPRPPSPWPQAPLLPWPKAPLLSAPAGDRQHVALLGQKRKREGGDNSRAFPGSKRVVLRKDGEHAAAQATAFRFNSTASALR